MSISNEGRVSLRYVGVTVFCAVFALIYEMLGHGVLSWYMILLPLWPLLGGSLPFLLLARIRIQPVQMTRCLYHAGLITLTVGSCVTGVFEIYGSMSTLVQVYWTAGACLIAAAVADFIWWCLRGRRAIQ